MNDRSLEVAASHRLAGTPILTLVVGLALLSPASAQPMPKIGACPSGYHHSGGYFAPSSTARASNCEDRRPGTTSAAAIVLGRKALGTPCIGSAARTAFRPVEPIVESPLEGCQRVCRFWAVVSKPTKPLYASATEINVSVRRSPQ